MYASYSLENSPNIEHEQYKYVGLSNCTYLH